jgi:predicted DsbA family dithiol-disulfide isomerase
MNDRPMPELWECEEYYDPWCYVATVRLNRVQREYEGRVDVRVRLFPLEVPRSETVPRDILEGEAA